METAIFYNTFFAVPKKINILETIKSSPDDIIGHIASYLDVKNLIAKERMDKLDLKRMELKKRTLEQWIEKIQSNTYYGVQIEKCKKVYKVTSMFITPKNIKNVEGLLQINKVKYVYDLYITLCNKIHEYTLPIPKEVDEVYTSQIGNRRSIWKARYLSIREDNDRELIFVDGQYIKKYYGCQNMKLIWW